MNARVDLFRVRDLPSAELFYPLPGAVRRDVQGADQLLGKGFGLAGSDDGELATLKKVAFQRLAGHAQRTENRIWPLVDQIKLALAAAFTGRSVIMG